MQTIEEKIKQRRQQMLVHSILYYEFDSPIISDKLYDVWARELVQLQKDYPKEARKVVLNDVFSDWDGNTGYDIHQNQDKYYDVARALLIFEKRMSKGDFKI